MAGYRIEIAHWPQDRADLGAVREAVFVVEQGVPLKLEWDGLDPQCSHFLARDPDGQPIGTARLCPEGHVGRMAVLPPWRGKGVGRALLLAVLEAARAQGIEHLHLNAQTSAEGFYQRAGFRSRGEAFLDAGIPHRHMVHRP